MVPMNLFAGQGWRQTQGIDLWTRGRGRRGWGELREQHWKVCISVCKADSRWEFAVWHRELKRTALWLPGGMGWGGRWEGGSRWGIYVYLWLIHADVWQKSTQYCKAVILQLKTNKLKKEVSLTLNFEEWVAMKWWKKVGGREKAF